MAQNNLNVPSHAQEHVASLKLLADGSRLRAFARDLLQARELRLFIVILAAAVFLYLRTPAFSNEINLRAVGIGLATDAVIAIAMTVLLVSGAFDLSVGSMVAFSGVIIAMLLNRGNPILPSMALTLLVGAGIGLINGLLVAFVRINPLITTLGMMTILSSATLVLSGGYAQTGLPDAFLVLGQGEKFGVPVPILIVLISVIVGDFLLRRSRWLRLVYYIGDNPEAAALTGIKVRRMQIFSFMLVAAAAATAGMIATSRLSSAFPLSGKGTELRVIAACVIGGCSLNGGEGSIFGAFLGVVLMALINNALVLLNVSVYWQGIVSGLVLLGAVVFDIWSKRQKTG